MNYLDTYDLTRPETPNPVDAPPAAQPTLNEEVTQVIGQLGRFWGGFRKQSQTALEAARKDFSEVVVQAQKELTKFTGAEEAQTAPSTEKATDGNSNADVSGTPVAGPSTAESADTTDAAAAAAAPREAGDEPHLAASSSGTLFGRLQSALPPQLVASVQNNLTTTTASLRQIDLPGLRTNVLAELQRVQEEARATAGGVAQRSEALLREAVREAETVLREAGDVLSEAVKVLPPDAPAGAGVSSAQGLVWDGADMWMLPAEGAGEAGGSALRRASESSARGPLETQSAVATRAEALLQRLQRDPEIVRHDPAAEEGVRERFEAWQAAEVDTLEGGVDGAEWRARIEALLEDPTDGSALKQLEQTLVPAEMTSSVFWLRFFFRTHQIRAEEEKRKALIQSTADNDEDFSWEDEDEDVSPTNQAKSPTAAASADGSKAPEQSLSIPASKSTGTPGAGTPRVSSEDSFDLVSNASVVGEEKPPAPAAPGAVEEDGDSDWE
ncbi:hypothetical protein HYPSUDRAFT_128459 [Hypholoma sublateritium FD-334 SS-4]|uniref:BSD domain-containing protein n=1 Tax=Hypholoma sublateritium (strain FD-334 SS-4) TaxID=945553 RepID=A0A0D2PKR3_HYPSF|nr:hypothetical protein HYPSUDRAFT_128459 [Hypholoma sublateritium FD-334 SS-4]